MPLKIARPAGIAAPAGQDFHAVGSIRRPRENRENLSVTHTEYLTLIYRLGLKPCSKKTAKYLGLSVRQLQRIYAAQASVPRPVALLLRLYNDLLASNKPAKKS